MVTACRPWLLATRSKASMIWACRVSRSASFGIADLPLSSPGTKIGRFTSEKAKEKFLRAYEEAMGAVA